MEGGTRYHILLLDIKLGEGENGIQTAVRLQELHHVRSSVIFVSAYPQYAVDSFRASPLYFLTKPVQEDTLRRALGNALKKWEEDGTLELADIHQAVHVVRLGDIEYLEIYDRRYVLHVTETGGGEGESPRDMEIVCRSGLGDILDRLLEPRFFRCHRNFLVNMGNVKSLSKNCLHVRSGARIPVARRKYEDALIAYTKNRGR